MTIILLIYIVMCLIGAKWHTYHDNYISLENSNAIKGIFVGFVFFRHYAQYVELDSAYDTFFYYVNGCLGQMIVVAFLFYSGYGVTQGIMKKGESYVRDIPTQRVLKVWIHYIIAVVLFLVANLAIGQNVSLKKFLMTLVWWQAIGNSNWYIMAIVISYLLTYVAFMIGGKNYKKAALIQTTLTVATIVVLIPIRPDRYYNTLLCFSVGIWYALIKEKIEEFLTKKSSNYYVTLMICAVICFIANWKREVNVAVYEIAAIAFIGTIILVTMKLEINNRFIQYMGNHVFSLYILQRLPMLCLAKTTELTERPYVFFAVSVVITFVISYVFDKCMKIFDKLAFSSKCLER